MCNISNTPSGQLQYIRHRSRNAICRPADPALRVLLFLLSEPEEGGSVPASLPTESGHRKKPLSLATFHCFLIRKVLSEADLSSLQFVFSLSALYCLINTILITLPVMHSGAK